MHSRLKQAVCLRLLTHVVLLSAACVFVLLWTGATRAQMTEQIPKRKNQKVVDALSSSLEIERDSLATYDAALRTGLPPADLRQTLVEIQIEHEKHEKAAREFLEREGATGDEIVIARKNYARMGSLREVLERLIREEERCIESHTRSRKRVKGAPAKADFETMIEHERKHIDTLKSVLASLPQK